MDLSLEQRLLRFLNREDEGERRSFRDLRALAIEERVLEGECIQNARFERVDGDEAFVFRVTENVSKFRRGDALVVGDGCDFDGAAQLAYESFDAEQGVLRLARDRFARGDAVELDASGSYVIDRRPFGLRGRLQDVVGHAFADPAIREVLEGGWHPVRDDDRHARAIAHLRASTDLNDAQVEAGAAAIASERLALIQGPPGTGKTRLLAEILRALCSKGCRIALSAFTHRAVDNVLLALRELDARIPLVKLGNPGSSARELRTAGIRFVPPRRADQLPRAGCVIAGTCFALERLYPDQGFHFTVFDEAGQLPMSHALAGMLLAKRWIFVGDHRQLPPVITAHHADREVTVSVFEHLHERHGSHLLDVTYRLNAPLCEVISTAFYGGALRSAPGAAERRMPFQPGGAFDAVLDPEHAVVLARVDHLHPGMRSLQEARLVADLVDELIRRHRVAGHDIAIVAPFRAQVRMIRSALQTKRVPDAGSLVVDTVERIQGQEREVVLVSMAVGDPDTLSRRSSFFFSTNRLNVALSRARTKAILVASRGAFEALPDDPEALRAAATFRRLFKTLHQVDLTPVYGGVAPA